MEVDLEKSKFFITGGEHKDKEFPLENISFRKNKKDGKILIKVSKNREYAIENSEQVRKRLD